MVKTPIRWIVHLKDGKTMVDGGSTEVENVPSNQISSIENISPDGHKVIVCANPHFSNFYTLVTASITKSFTSNKTIHSEDERIVGFDVNGARIEVIINCHTGNVKIKGRRP